MSLYAGVKYYHENCKEGCLRWHKLFCLYFELPCLVADVIKGVMIIGLEM